MSVDIWLSISVVNERVVVFQHYFPYKHIVHSETSMHHTGEYVPQATPLHTSIVLLCRVFASRRQSFPKRESHDHLLLAGILPLNVSGDHIPAEPDDGLEMYLRF